MSNQHYIGVRYTERGYVTLVATIVAAAIAASLLTTHVLQGVVATQTAAFATESTQAHAVTEACAESALEQIRSNTSFSGSNTLTFAQGTCTYTVTTTGGQSRQLAAEGIVNDAVQRIEIVVTAINPTIEIQSWQTVSSF